MVNELPQKILDDNAKLKVYQENRDHKRDKEKKEREEMKAHKAGGYMSMKTKSMKETH